ncbi:NADH-quinone oxidoreductase subunit NuoB [Candidatus Villigracilis saccharophilus]|uniref:NADH-quinone oxidoreductase subunit B n=1 Tax=Candidatus Villigracilis saccharophilus TaxID=3140684 RepID=UPI0031EA0A05
MENEKLSLPNYSIPEDIQNVVAITTLDRLYNWGRRSSVWPLMFGLACCAIEMIAAQTARYDMARFGMEVMRPTPRQADMMLVSGTVTKKMLPSIIRLYNQMPEPKYVVAMGACASSGGPFKEGYNVVAGIDKFLPVDVYIPGCPPTPQALIAGMIKLQEKIDKQSIKSVTWYNKEKKDGNYVPMPILGPDLIDVRRNAEIKQVSAQRRVHNGSASLRPLIWSPVSRALSALIHAPATQASSSTKRISSKWQPPSATNLALIY